MKKIIIELDTKAETERLVHLFRIWFKENNEEDILKSIKVEDLE